MYAILDVCTCQLKELLIFLVTAALLESVFF